MKEYLEVLRKCALFDSIDDDQLMAMLGCLGGRVKQYEKNERIFAEKPLNC